MVPLLPEQRQQLMIDSLFCIREHSDHLANSLLPHPQLADFRLAEWEWQLQWRKLRLPATRSKCHLATLRDRYGHRPEMT